MNYVDWSESFDLSENRAQNLSAYSPALSGFKLVLGEHDQYLYGLLSVEDSAIRYADPGKPFSRSDAIEIVYQNAQLEIQTLLLKPVSPGVVTVSKLVENWDFSRSLKTVNNVIGAWQEKANGYTVEVRLPLHTMGSLLGFIVHDDVGRDAAVDADSLSSSMFIAGTNANNTRSRPNRLLRNSAQLKQMIGR